MADRKIKDKKDRRRIDKYGMYTFILLLVFAAAIVVISLYMHSQLRKINTDDRKYRYHFAYIGKSEDSYTSNHVFDEAWSYGKESNVYVEKLRTGSGASYTDSDYVRMAVDMGVNGIIIEASGDDSLSESIDEASLAGIPVITILSDCEGSRKSFIEIGDYNLGREYARTIIDITKNRTPRVLLFADGTDERSAGIIEGINSTLANEGNHLNVQMTVEDVGGLPNFRLSDRTKEALLDEENGPDILICINEHDTKVVYQAVRDYELAGRSQIIGYGISEPLLRAVRDEEIAALIDADAAQLGMLCVDALLNYHKNGSCNEYMIVDDTVVTKDNIARYLDEK